MRRFPAILVAIMVGLANALCACADSSISVFPRENAPEPEKSHCHSTAQQQASSHCSSDSDSPDHEEHGPCGHCNGTVSADVTQVKVMVPEPVPGPLLFIAVFPEPLDLERQFVHRWFDHTGLSPPVLPMTLLSLFCALNN